MMPAREEREPRIAQSSGDVLQARIWRHVTDKQPDIWSGWTSREKAAIVCEFSFRSEEVFKEEWAKARWTFFWMTCIPIIGCITVPYRLRLLSARRSDMEEASTAQHLAVTPEELIYVVEAHRKGTLRPRYVERQRRTVALNKIQHIEVLPAVERRFMPDGLGDVRVMALDTWQGESSITFTGLERPYEFKEAIAKIRSGEFFQDKSKKAALQRAGSDSQSAAEMGAIPAGGGSNKRHTIGGLVAPTSSSSELGLQGGSRRHSIGGMQPQKAEFQPLVPKLSLTAVVQDAQDHAAVPDAPRDRLHGVSGRYMPTERVDATVIIDTCEHSSSRISSGTSSSDGRSSSSSGSGSGRRPRSQHRGRWASSSGCGSASDAAETDQLLGGKLRSDREEPDAVPQGGDSPRTRALALDAQKAVQRALKVAGSHEASQAGDIMKLLRSLDSTLTPLSIGADAMVPEALHFG